MSTYSQWTMVNQPLAYWRLDETSGTVATDQTGRNNGTYINGPTLNQTPGALTGGGDTDACVSFVAASSQYVSCGSGIFNYAAPTTPGPYTMRCWFNMTNNVAQAFMEQGLNNPSHKTGLIYYQPFQSVFFFIQDNNGDLGIVVPTATLTGNWHQLVGTWDGNSTISVYLDGQGRSAGGQSNVVVSGTTSLGASSTFGYYLNGKLDEAAIFPTCWTPAQVATDYLLGTQTAWNYKVQANPTGPGWQVVDSVLGVSVAQFAEPELAYRALQQAQIDFNLATRGYPA